MELREKLELKKEITNEVREDIARSTEKLVTRRILLALAIIGLEAFIWLLITSSVVNDKSIHDGVFASYFVLCMRLGQIGAFQWFRAE
jgi:hypothetical protein